MDYLEEFKATFDVAFEAYLRQKIGALSLTPYLEEIGAHLIEFSRGGKRIRPFIAAAAYEGSGGTEPEKIEPLLFAIELFHIYALIHDDIVDKATTRHGIPCMHTLFGVNQAILVGDLCAAWAYDAIGQFENALPLREIFSALAEETIVGQMIDVSLAEGEPVTETLLDECVDRKTSRYTFIYPAFLGRILAGAEDNAEIYAAIGGHLGHAYQRLDDLADIFFEESELGKLPGLDIMHGVATHISMRIAAEGTPTEQTLLAHSFGKPDQFDIRAVREMLHTSNTVEAEKAAIEQRLDQVEVLLDEISLQGTAREKWLACTRLLRDKLNNL